MWRQSIVVLEQRFLAADMFLVARETSIWPLLRAEPPGSGKNYLWSDIFVGGKAIGQTEKLLRHHLQAARKISGTGRKLFWSDNFLGPPFGANVQTFRDRAEISFGVGDFFVRHADPVWRTFWHWQASVFVVGTILWTLEVTAIFVVLAQKVSMIIYFFVTPVHPSYFPKIQIAGRQIFGCEKKLSDTICVQ